MILFLLRESIYLREKNLQLFIPADKLRRKNASYWSKMILKEYEVKYSSMENSNDIVSSSMNKFYNKFLLFVFFRNCNINFLFIAGI